MGIILKAVGIFFGISLSVLLFAFAYAIVNEELLAKKNNDALYSDCK